jgi:hypothetical protein
MAVETSTGEYFGVALEVRLGEIEVEGGSVSIEAIAVRDIVVAGDKASESKARIWRHAAQPLSARVA